MPYLDEAIIEDLYYKVINKEITNVNEELLLPFLSSDKIKKLFYEYLGSVNKIDK